MWPPLTHQQYNRPLPHPHQNKNSWPDTEKTFLKLLTLPPPTNLEEGGSIHCSICSQTAFPPFWNSDHVAVSASFDFPSYHHIHNRISCLIGSGGNWSIYPSMKVSGQASLIFMVLSCLCCCHSSQKSLFSFAPKG